MKVSDAIADILRREGVETDHRLSGQPHPRARRGRRHPPDHRAPGAHRPAHGRRDVARDQRPTSIGVFVMQHGPGTENAYGGVAQAWSESVPILVMPGGYARRLAWVERNYNASVQMRGITKSAEPVTVGQGTVRDHAPRLHAAALRARRAGAGRGAERRVERGGRPVRLRASRGRCAPAPIRTRSAKPRKCCSPPSARCSTPARACTGRKPGAS